VVDDRGVEPARGAWHAAQTGRLSSSTLRVVPLRSSSEASRACEISAIDRPVATSPEAGEVATLFGRKVPQCDLSATCPTAEGISDWISRDLSAKGRDADVRHPDLIAALAKEHNREIAAHRYRVSTGDTRSPRRLRRWLGVRLVRIGQSLGAPPPEPRPAAPRLEAC
jgi:hypothetical protein